MVDGARLEMALRTRIIVTRDGSITKPLDAAAATASRDSLAKTLYTRLFDWLVSKINHSIGQDPESNNFIGVLDIYGFESFKSNSFEQFCINLANEKLQQHFNQHVFKMEQEVNLNTPDPELCTPNPEFSTLNPAPCTLHPEPCTLNPAP